MEVIAHQLTPPNSLPADGELAYHVTPITNWPSIAQKGLIAQIGPRSKMLDEVPAVFLFPTLEDCHTALSSWLGDEFEDVPEDGLLILVVDISGLPYQQSVEFEREVLADVPADRIHSVLGEDWVPLSSDDVARLVLGESPENAALKIA